MRRKLIISAAICLALVVSVATFQAWSAREPQYNATYGTGDSAITVATGSPGSLGLLKELAEPFCQLNHCRVNWIKKGSGASLEALKAGQVDLVMVHAPAAEKRAVREGWATMRTLLGSNEFYIVGPGDDPAGIKTARTAKETYAKIARAQARFFSRGDKSGTHKKEMMIWGLAGIRPAGDWYIITHDFMGPTLMRADKEMGYFMTDSSTFYVKKAKIRNLEILFRGDPILVNVYHALVTSQETYPEANYALAIKFLKFLSSPDGQAILREYGKAKYGSALYNDAEYAKQRED